MEYGAPFQLNQQIVLNLTTAQANGNLGNLAGGGLALGQFNDDTIPPNTVFTIPLHYQYIMEPPVTVLGTIINNGKIVLLP